MSDREGDPSRLRYLRDAAQAALAFTMGKTPADLVNDLMLPFAVVRALEIVGEAPARHTPKSPGKPPSE